MKTKKNFDDQITSHQNETYENYLKIENNPRYLKAWSYIENYKFKQKKVKLLDIGCTNGEFSEYLLKKGYECYGLEVYEEAIKESKQKGIKVKEGSFLEKFPFKSNTFDIVFAGEVIEHTIRDDNFLKEVNRVLKPKGLFILTTPNLVSLGNRFLMLIGKLPRFAYAEFHYKIYTPSLIREKMYKSNFQIKKMDASYILISTAFNKYIGKIGEYLGSKFPKFGENLIIYSIKK